MINRESVTPDQIIEKIKEDMEQLDNFFIRYHLKKLGLRHLRQITLDRVKACYFLEKYGLWITGNMLTAIVGKHTTTNLTALHSLGDKNIIHLRGYHGLKLAWRFDKELTEMIEGKTEND